MLVTHSFAGYTQPDQFDLGSPIYGYSAKTTLKFTDEINSEGVNTDPNNLWNTTNFTYTHVGGTFSERFTIAVDLLSHFLVHGFQIQN